MIRTNKIITTYVRPPKLLIPFKKRIKINGKLFFKYRQCYRNKTLYVEGLRRILSRPIQSLFTSKLLDTPRSSGMVFRMIRYNKT